MSCLESAEETIRIKIKEMYNLSNQYLILRSEDAREAYELLRFACEQLENALVE